MAWPGDWGGLPSWSDYWFCSWDLCLPRQRQWSRIRFHCVHSTVCQYFDSWIDWDISPDAVLICVPAGCRAMGRAIGDSNTGYCRELRHSCVVISRASTLGANWYCTWGHVWCLGCWVRWTLIPFEALGMYITRINFNDMKHKGIKVKEMMRHFFCNNWTLIFACYVRG